ncbi:hypothetical protein BH10BDE1_BH10BDE1_30300 [soil metagenome]
MTAFFKIVSTLLLALTIAMTITMPTSAFAQGSTTEKPPTGGPRRQLGTIIYAGLGGAVLGLSTLSFYGRPQDNLRNIAIGFALGVIGGTVAVTYSAATNPDEFYGAQIDRDTLLGPATSMTIVANRKADDSSSALSASFEIFKF